MKRSLVALAAAGAALHALAGVPVSYTIVDLGADQQPRAANAKGTVVGNTISTGRAVSYANGTWTPLPQSSATGGALAINAKGTVVGWDGRKSTEWANGKRQGLSGTQPGQANAIAADGTIVGSEFGGSYEYCYQWKDGTKSGLYGGGDGDCYALAIDSTATYIGGQGSYHAFLIDPNGLHDLGTLQGADSSSSLTQAVNKHGHAAVWSTFDSTQNWGAAYWNGTALVDIGAHPAGVQSYATAINDNDEVLVGGSDGAGHVLFLYEGHSGVLKPIEPLIGNPAGWSFDNDVTDILAALANDGTIYGAAHLGGAMHAFKLVPVKQ